MEINAGNRIHRKKDMPPFYAKALEASMVEKRFDYFFPIQDKSFMRYTVNSAIRTGAEREPLVKRNGPCYIVLPI